MIAQLGFMAYFDLVCNVFSHLCHLCILDKEVLEVGHRPSLKEQSWQDLHTVTTTPHFLHPTWEGEGKEEEGSSER